MDKSQIIVSMLDIGSAVIKHYYTDIRHDAKLISEAECGDTFLWAPYEMGTRIVVLTRGSKGNELARSTFDAMNNSEVKQWYHISLNPITCMIHTIDSDYVELVVEQAMDKAAQGDKVSELHM